jgi:uncharacterized protein (UPF0210 family)
MKIRSITYFLDPGSDQNLRGTAAAGAFLSAARQAFSEAGYEVQTVRLATTPFPRWISDPARVPAAAQALEQAASAAGIQHVSMGPASPAQLEYYAPIPAALARTQSVFLTGRMTTPQQELSFPAARACARVIAEAAQVAPAGEAADGFANLRFSALANVAAGTPFFPAAYHGGPRPAFALALECADLAVAAFRGCQTLVEGRMRLVRAVEYHAARLEETAARLSASQKIAFGGLDFTLAPFPDDLRSIGAALEAVGAPAAGSAGTLAATAVLAEALDRAVFHKTGFCGVMLPVLEDSVLAERAAQGLLTVQSLLLYSAVCGTGLDCIPLPGDTTPEQLEAILVDVAALALRLNKQLTARLLPVPGKAAGDRTGFSFDYFANSRIFSAAAAPLRAPLRSDETLEIRPKR